jgi:hypothetical protein
MHPSPKPHEEITDKELQALLVTARRSNDFKASYKTYLEWLIQTLSCRIANIRSGEELVRLQGKLQLAQEQYALTYGDLPKPPQSS